MHQRSYQVIKTAPLESHTQMDPAPLESHTQMELQKEEQELLLDQIHMIYEKKLDKVRKYFLKEIQDLKGIIEQQTEVLQEVKKSHEAELSEICLKHSKELQAEKETCSNLNNKMKLMQKQFQKMKEVMQVQSHEISTLKEEVQGLHDQHKDEEKTKSLEKMQNKTVQEQLRNTKIVVEKMKSSILQLERSAVSQMKSQTFEPRPPQTPHPKIQKFAMPAVVLSQEMEKNHQDMTQEKWTKFDACVRIRHSNFYFYSCRLKGFTAEIWKIPYDTALYAEHKKSEAKAACQNCDSRPNSTTEFLRKCDISSYKNSEHQMMASSAFNTITPSKLITKLKNLELDNNLCDWFLDFLTNRPQGVKIRNSYPTNLTLSMDAPQGCVLSPLLYQHLSLLVIHSSWASSLMERR
ncbi:hypothetical protein QTP70_012948 [Hemibagrus guttatus]|uniref:Uncharacterized protein n=1 Tax=Hemibagrus guttatus TaxID=175788 RepID=A0AAE0UU56_9TELE|nr:hypothetical protein QTP70_012948 [Hemibagrus guttatus]